MKSKISRIGVISVVCLQSSLWSLAVSLDLAAIPAPSLPQSLSLPPSLSVFPINRRRAEGENKFVFESSSSSPSSSSVRISCVKLVLLQLLLSPPRPSPDGGKTPIRLFVRALNAADTIKHYDQIDEDSAHSNYHSV